MSKSNNVQAQAVDRQRKQSRDNKRMLSEFALLPEGFTDALPASCARFTHDARFTDDVSMSSDALDRFSIDQYVP